MEWWRIAIGVGLGLVVVWLLHAANVIGQNPHLRVKMHEDLVGAKFPEGMPLEEKQYWLDQFGISRRNAKQTALWIAISFVGACILYLFGGQ